MKKNETQFYFNKSVMQKNFIKLKNKNSKSNTLSKFNFSRNSFLKIKNKTSSNFNIYKNCILLNNSSKDFHNKNDDFLFNNINSFSNKKINSINSVQFNLNNHRNISSKNIRSKKVFSSRTYDKKINANIIHWLNITQIKKKKIDFIKYKFLLGQKNYYKRLFDQDDLGFSLYYSKKIKPYSKKNSKIYSHEELLKKLFLEQEELNAQSMKDGSKNLSIISFKNNHRSPSKKNIFRLSNYTNLRIRKYNTPNVLKKSNELLLESNKSKLIVRNTRYNMFEKSEEKEDNKNCNISKGKEKNIDDIYKEYLNGISSSESNKSKSKNLSKKKYQYKICSIKSLKNKFLLNSKNEISQSIRKINENNNSNKNIKNHFNFTKYIKFNLDRRKILEDNCKSIAIKNPLLRKKIMLEKIN